MLGKNRYKKFGQGHPPPLSGNAQKKTFIFMGGLPLYLLKVRLNPQEVQPTNQQTNTRIQYNDQYLLASLYGAAKWKHSCFGGVVHSLQSTTTNKNCNKHSRTHKDQVEKRKFAKSQVIKQKSMNSTKTKQAGRKQK